MSSGKHPEAPAGQRLGRDTFLYLEPTTTRPRRFAQCDSCGVRLNGPLRCGIMGGREVVEDGTCGAYVEGKGVERVLCDLSPEAIGYVVRPVRCENCKWGGTECGLYVKLNRELPALFDLDTHISPHGCCNANTAKVAPADAKLTAAELDDLLAYALAHPRIKKRLARPFRLDTSYDIALLGSSSVGGERVYLDRHFRLPGLPFCTLLIDGKRLDTKPGLIRHERLEQALEDELGWPYLPVAHFVAQHWEEQDYKAKGFDPGAVEQAFKPFIKKDEHERIVRTPPDLDMRPLLAPPASTELIVHINKTAQKEKKSQKAAGYVMESPQSNKACGRCRSFVRAEYGGPGCIKVRLPISESGTCLLFVRGVLGDEGGGGNA